MRDIILVIIAVLCVYVMFEFWRAYRVGRSGPDPDEHIEVDPTELLDDAASSAQPDFGLAPEDEDAVRFEPSVRHPVRPSSEPAAADSNGSFQLELEVRQLRRDITQLRSELSEQRHEIERIHLEFGATREHLESSLANQGISPEYNEALVYARRGMGADEIAAQCGISLAEAELVHALAHGGGTNKGDAT